MPTPSAHSARRVRHLNTKHVHAAIALIARACESVRAQRPSMRAPRPQPQPTVCVRTVDRVPPIVLLFRIPTRRTVRSCVGSSLCAPRMSGSRWRRQRRRTVSARPALNAGPTTSLCRRVALRRIQSARLAQTARRGASDQERFVARRSTHAPCTALRPARRTVLSREVPA